MNHDAYLKKTCRYCDAELPEAFLDLGTMPLANNLPAREDLDKDPFVCPLQLTKCSECHLVQLMHVVPPGLMFDHYLYVSSTTKTFRQHFADYAKDVHEKLKVKESLLAVDIGSNDGLLLSCYKQEGMRAVGIDPAKNLCEEANRQGHTTLNRYFDAEAVKTIRKDFGAAHVVSGNNVFAHIDDIQSVLRNVNDLLDTQGIFVIEFPYLVTMLEELLFDMIYHEHLSYIGVNALSFVLDRFGFELFDIRPVASHGGSLRVFIQKKGGPYAKTEIVTRLMDDEKNKGYLTAQAYQTFADNVRQVKKEFVNCVNEIKASGKSISGYGAPAKASTIIHFYEFRADQIDFIVDDNPLKQNRWIPSAKIPIVPSKHLEEHPTDCIIIFAWNFAKEIIGKLGAFRSKGVRFLIPLYNPNQEDLSGPDSKAFDAAASS